MKSTLAATGDDAVDSVVRDNPLALLIAMLLDQQISIEMAFTGPFRLQERIGEISCDRILGLSEDELVAHFVSKPALHRFPAAMARRTRALADYLSENHRGRAELVWQSPGSAKELLDRINAMPGFGPEKSMILLAVLGKRMGVTPEGWRDHAGAFGDDTPRSVADIDSDEARERVRAWKKQQRAKGLTKQQ